MPSFEDMDRQIWRAEEEAERFYKETRAISETLSVVARDLAESRQQLEEEMLDAKRYCWLAMHLLSIECLPPLPIKLSWKREELDGAIDEAIRQEMYSQSADGLTSLPF